MRQSLCRGERGGISDHQGVEKQGCNVCGATVFDRLHKTGIRIKAIPSLRASHPCRLLQLRPGKTGRCGTDSHIHARSGSKCRSDHSTGKLSQIRPSGCERCGGHPRIPLDHTHVAGVWLCRCRFVHMRHQCPSVDCFRLFAGAARMCESGIQRFDTGSL